MDTMNSFPETNHLHHEPQLPPAANIYKTYFYLNLLHISSWQGIKPMNYLHLLKMKAVSILTQFSLYIKDKNSLMHKAINAHSYQSSPDRKLGGLQSVWV
jgi:hypothetical protein